MERARAKKVNKRPRATELSRLKRDLQRVSKQLKSRDRELAEAQEQQTTTGEILRAIASSSTNLQSVLDTLAESAGRLCEANDGQLRLIEGDGLKLVASFGPKPPTHLTPLSRSHTPRQTKKSALVRTTSAPWNHHPPFCKRRRTGYSTPPTLSRLRPQEPGM